MWLRFFSIFDAMKSITAISILLLYGMVLFRPALQVVDYYVQLQQYKARCVNKSKPELHCDGTCLLAQKIKAMEEEQGSPVAPSPLKINVKDFPVGIFQHFTLQQPFRVAFNFSEVSYLEKFASQSVIDDIFHPPSSSPHPLV
jgi:hypothetical protein